jgi:hypothetical protein
LLFQGRQRNLAVTLGKNLLQMTLKLIKRRIEPPQSTWLVHCASPLPAQAPPIHPLWLSCGLHQQPGENVVTLCSTFNDIFTTLFSNLTFHGFDSAAKHVI